MVHSDILIRKGRVNDRDAFALLQVNNLDGQEDVDLLRLFYYAMLRQKGFISVCAVRANQVIGFACCVNRKPLRLPLLSRYPLEVGRLMLRRPSLTGRMLTRVFDAAKARLTATAMDPQLPPHECGPVVVNHQFRNMRVGTLLMGAMNQAMEERRIPAAFLRVSSHNQPARRLYESFGYVPVRREGDGIVMVIRFRQCSMAN